MIRKPIGSRDIIVNNARQIINMGGPYIGDISTKENGLIVEDCVLNNYVFDEINNRFYYVKYHCVSKWRSGIYFTINVYDSNEGMNFEYEKHFDMIYIKRLVNKDEMEVYLAFHDQIESTKYLFNFRYDDFVRH